MLPIGEITDTEYLRQMSRTETSKYIFQITIKQDRTQIDESKVKYIKKQSYYWTYPHTKNNRCYEYVYQTLAPMTLKECTRLISELGSEYSDLEENFEYITKIVQKEND